jgi:hypothetical protein
VNFGEAGGLGGGKRVTQDAVADFNGFIGDSAAGSENL